MCDEGLLRKRVGERCERGEQNKYRASREIYEQQRGGIPVVSRTNQAWHVDGDCWKGKNGAESESLVDLSEHKIAALREFFRWSPIGRNLRSTPRCVGSGDSW